MNTYYMLGVPKGKPIGKPQENPRKTLGKPWENGGLPSAKLRWNITDINIFDAHITYMAIFTNYVSH